MKIQAKIANGRGARRQQGAALAEYGLLVAGLALSSMVAVSVLGGKVGGMIASVATLLPGASAEENAPVQVGKLVETQTVDANGDGIFETVLSSQALEQNAQRPTNRMGNALNMQGHEVGHLYQLGDRSLHQ